MAKRKAMKKVPKRTRVSPMDQLRKALTKQTKAKLLDVIVDLARNNRTIMRDLQARFNVKAPPKDLVACTRQAIGDATDFDEREMNSNFDYDYQAYGTIGKNLKQLLRPGCLAEAMELSIQLMSEGSYQVEMSDEGMMTDSIEECLQVVIKGITTSDLPAKEVVQ